MEFPKRRSGVWPGGTASGSAVRSGSLSRAAGGRCCCSRSPSVDAVVVSCADDFSAVHYCSQPGRFFSVSGEAGEEALEYELTRIVETRLGLVCAHEGVEP